MSNQRARMLVEALASAPKDLTRLLRPLTEFQSTAVTGDHWSAAQIVYHLAQIELLSFARFVRINEEDNPREPFIHPDLRGYSNKIPVDHLLTAFTVARATTTDFLASLSPQQWLRKCTHETLGVAKLHQMVRLLIAHDSDHLAQIATLREQFNALQEVEGQIITAPRMAQNSGDLAFPNSQASGKS